MAEKGRRNRLFCSLLICVICSVQILQAAETETAVETQTADEMETIPGTQPADGTELVHLDFEDGETDGFMIYTNGGKCEIENVDQALAVHISDCGKLDYANQVYWDGFSLGEGCDYIYSFEISCDIERTAEYRLQLNGGDYHAYESGLVRIGPEKQTIQVEWTMTEPSDPAPRLVFNLGKMEDMSEDPGEHTVYLDEIRLIQTGGEVVSAEDALPELPVVCVNQIGYLPEDTKTVVWREIPEEGSEEKTVPPASFQVMREDEAAPADEADSADELVAAEDTDTTEEPVREEVPASSEEQDPAGHAGSENVVLEGMMSEGSYDKATGLRLQHGDFSGITEPGMYRIEVTSGERHYESAPFRIGADVYSDVEKAVVHMLYLQRCGSELPEEYAGAFAHPACHTGEALVYGTEETRDVSGGWHDAGDYGRYVVSGAKAAADLMLACTEFGMDGDDLGLPESGNQVPDLLDEVRYELEWMMKMQDPQTGGVHHKVTCAAFPGEVMPQEETEQLILSPISTAATGDFAAVMAKASRLYTAYDPEFASQAYQAALRAWDYVKNLNDSTGFVNPEEITTGEYPDRGTGDEIFWAAAELYLSGDDVSAEDLLEHCPDYLRPGLGWQRITTYGIYDLLQAGNPDNEKKQNVSENDNGNDNGNDKGNDNADLVRVKDVLREKFLEEAKTIAENASKDGFGVSLEMEYPWGSNMTVANNAVEMLMAERLTGDAAYKEAAKQHLDYLLGANAAGYCYVTGFGSMSPQYPHHRPSQAVGEAVSGMLVGGPNSNLEDPYARAVLGGRAPALCYVDSEQSYSTNETAIYWNSALICLLSGVGK